MSGSSRVSYGSVICDGDVDVSGDIVITVLCGGRVVRMLCTIFCILRAVTSDDGFVIIVSIRMFRFFVTIFWVGGRHGVLCIIVCYFSIYITLLLWIINSGRPN